MKAKQQESFPKKWVGICEVITGDTRAKFTSVETVRKDGKDTGKVKEFPNEETSMRFEIKDLPKAAQRIIKPNNKKPMQVRIRLNEDADEVENVTPVVGVFPGKAVSLGPAKKDQDPAPFEKFYHKGESDENSHLEFFVVYKITEGVFRDVELPAFNLHYKFEGVPEGEEDEGMTRFDTVDTPNASQLHKLQDWAAVQGDILEEPIVWPDDGNILPTLQERMLDADRPVNLVIERGYVKAVQPLIDYGEAEEEETAEEFEEKFPVKKTSQVTDEVEEEVKEIKYKSKAPAKLKTPVKKLSKKSSDEDDDL